MRDRSADEWIPTTHVGSLPRASAVRERLSSGPDDTATDDPAIDHPTDDAAFDAAVDEAVREVVRRQAAAGVDVANDGEQSRQAYAVDVTSRLSGFGEEFAERALPSDVEAVPGFAGEALGDVEALGGPVAEGPVEYVGREALERDLARFERAVDAEGVGFAGRFHTAPSPGAVLRFTESAYHDSTEAYLFDLADALRTEYETIVDAGFQLQVDAPELLAAFTITYKDATVGEFREHVEAYLEAIDHALAPVDPADVRLHACWGNYPGPHHHDVDLADVLDLLYGADVGGLVIEGANPRHAHEHRTVAANPPPDDWTLYPGVIDVKTNVVEHPEVVAGRLERFSDAVGDPARIVAACDCGFETVLGATLVHPEIVWKKLEALHDGAALASERLF